MMAARYSLQTAATAAALSGSVGLEALAILPAGGHCLNCCPKERGDDPNSTCTTKCFNPLNMRHEFLMVALIINFILLVVGVLSRCPRADGSLVREILLGFLMRERVKWGDSNQ